MWAALAAAFARIGATFARGATLTRSAGTVATEGRAASSGAVRAEAETATRDRLAQDAAVDAPESAPPQERPAVTEELAERAMSSDEEEREEDEDDDEEEIENEVDAANTEELLNEEGGTSEETTKNEEKVASTQGAEAAEGEAGHTTSGPQADTPGSNETLAPGTPATSSPEQQPTAAKEENAVAPSTGTTDAAPAPEASSNEGAPQTNTPSPHTAEQGEGGDAAASPSPETQDPSAPVSSAGAPQQRDDGQLAADTIKGIAAGTAKGVATGVREGLNDAANAGATQKRSFADFAKEGKQLAGALGLKVPPSTPGEAIQTADRAKQLLTDRGAQEQAIRTVGPEVAKKGAFSLSRFLSREATFAVAEGTGAGEILMIVKWSLVALAVLILVIISVLVQTGVIGGGSVDTSIDPRQGEVARPTQEQAPARAAIAPSGGILLTEPVMLLGLTADMMLVLNACGDVAPVRVTQGVGGAPGTASYEGRAVRLSTTAMPRETVAALQDCLSVQGGACVEELLGPDPGTCTSREVSCEERRAAHVRATNGEIAYALRRGCAPPATLGLQ